MVSFFLNAENGLLQQQAAVVSLLGIAVLVASLTTKFDFPYTVGLVVAGIGASFLGQVTAVKISPELILALLVPPLLFDATLQLNWKKLKAEMFPVLLLAIGGTLVGAFLMASLTNLSLGISWPAAFAFGALIAATDPVAVVAFFKSLGVPKRLTILIEGESLFNDAVAVVAFTLAVSAASGASLSAGAALSQFFVVSAGGLLIGLSIGYIISEVLINKIDDPVIETSLTLVTAYGVYLFAEEFGKLVGQPDLKLSGILAVVSAGLVVGNVGLRNASPSTRITLANFWELLTFLANSMVFLVIGLTVPPRTLIDNLNLVVFAVVSVMTIRVLVVYGVGFITLKARPRRRMPMTFQHVMVLGGLRGAISLALALTLSSHVDSMGDQTVRQIQTMTFGVVLFTLLVPGTTIEGLIRRLGLANKSRVEIKKQSHQARIQLTKAAKRRVDYLVSKGELFEDMGESLNLTYQQSIDSDSAALRQHFSDNPELEIDMLLEARQKIVASERSALSTLVQDDSIDRNLAAKIALELDNRTAALDFLRDRWVEDISIEENEERQDV